MSAIRNLNETEVGGRSLRISLADSDPLLQGKTTFRGEIIDSDLHELRGGHHVQSRHFSPLSERLRSGQSLQPGVTSIEAIEQVLAKCNTTEITELLAQTKVRTLMRNLSSLLSARCTRVSHSFRFGLSMS